MFYDMNHQEDHFSLATDIHNSLFFAKLVFSVVLSAPSAFLFLHNSLWREFYYKIRRGQERKGKERNDEMSSHKLNDIPRDSLKQFESKEKP